MTNSTFFQNASLHYLTLCLNTILATRKTISFNFPNNELNLTRKEVNCRVDENVKNRDLKKYFRKSFFDAFILSVSLFKDLAIFNLTFSAWVESGGKKTKIQKKLKNALRRGLANYICALKRLPKNLGHFCSDY
jgi:hypothetical protein